MIVWAVVLNIRDHRENDRIITCYTRQLGKIEILVRSAKKITSKLAHLTSGLYALLDLVIEPGKNFYHLVGGKAMRHYRQILNDYKKNILTAQILKIVDGVIKPAKIDQRIFELIVKSLERVDKTTTAQAEIIVLAFIIKLLAILGHKPEIKNCLICHKMPLAKFNFDVNRGGIVCLRCSTTNYKSNTNIQITDEVLNILQDLLYKNFDFLEKKKISTNDMAIVRNVIDKFLEWQLK